MSGYQIPLNVDAYLFATAMQNGATLINNWSVLDAKGTGAATLTIPAGTQPSLAGLTLDHAYVILGGNGQIEHVSNTSRLTLVN